MHDRCRKTKGQAVPFLGYGSLLSRASAEQTFGPLPDFRVVRVPGYARVFNKVCLHSIKSGAADPERRDIACACAVERLDAELSAALIHIPEDRAATFFEREREFRIVEAAYVDPETGATGKAFLCTMWGDEGLRMSFASEAAYEEHVGQYYSGKLWRDDILPARAYLGCCMRGAQTLNIGDRFLDETLLANGATLREYLRQHPEILDAPEGETPARYRDSQEP